MYFAVENSNTSERKHTLYQILLLKKKILSDMLYFRILR